MESYFIDLFDVLKLICGLSLFLFGMTLMGQALERRAGNKLKALLGRMTTNRFAGLLTGLGVTAIIQSSSATTVMVVGFVNSGLMTLRQSINVIMGANVGTTVTAWIFLYHVSGTDNAVLLHHGKAIRLRRNGNFQHRRSDYAVYIRHTDRIYLHFAIYGVHLI